MRRLKEVRTHLAISVTSGAGKITMATSVALSAFCAISHIPPTSDFLLSRALPPDQVDNGDD